MSENVTWFRIADEIEGTMPEGTFDPVLCIRAFDSGLDAVFILDESGRYTGKAITRENFRAAFASSYVKLEEIPSIVDEHTGGGYLRNMYRAA